MDHILHLSRNFHLIVQLLPRNQFHWDHDSIEIVSVAERLQDVGIEALAVHGRTRVQMYKGNADWKPIADIKNNQRMHIPVFGNGDVTTPELAVLMRDEFGLDGAMIGRASIGNPWFFQQIKHFFKTGEHLPPPSIAERVDVAKRHLEMAIKWNGEKIALLETRKHYTSYFKGIPNIKPYRLKMVTAPTKEEIFDVFNEVLTKF